MNPERFTSRRRAFRFLASSEAAQYSKPFLEGPPSERGSGGLRFKRTAKSSERQAAAVLVGFFIGAAACVLLSLAPPIAWFVAACPSLVLSAIVVALRVEASRDP